MTLPRFYRIFDDLVWLQRMLPLGVKIVQLRVKDKSPRDLRAQLAEARDLCMAHDAVLVVNDHWQLAIDLGCDWAHLRLEDLDAADLNAVCSAGTKTRAIDP